MINPSTIDLKQLPWLPLDEKTAFPKKSAIYFAIDSSGSVQYIGRAKNVHSRWGNHHKYDELNEIGDIKVAYLFVDVPELLPQIETALIEYFDPPLNTVKTRLVLADLSEEFNGRVRKTKVFRLNEAVLEGLTELAKRKNSSVNRLVENILFEMLKSKGVISTDVSPLGETRRGYKKAINQRIAKTTKTSGS